MPAEHYTPAGDTPFPSQSTPEPTMPGSPPGPDPAAQQVLGILRGMFEEVRRYLLSEGLANSERVGTNPKGEATRAFDAEAEQIALQYARAHLPSFRVLSEEAGELQIGDGPPRYTLVIDPCDGSNNFRRGVRVAGFAVAVLAGDMPVLDPALVQHAFVGDIFTGSFYTASRGSGASLDGRPIHGSTITELRRAMLSINFGRVHMPSRPGEGDDPHQTPLPATIWQLVSQISTARRLGATTLDLCYVAQGAFEGYVDLRRRLTPENFLAPALIIQEAGGFFGNEHGQPLGPVDFTTGYRVLAAGNQELLRQIVQALSEDRA